MLLFAPLLKNPLQAEISDAALWIEQDLIRYAGPRSCLPSEAHGDPVQYKIEDGILFPGLVNAHCHLELTCLEGLPYPGNFTDWIRKILEAKTNLGPEEQDKAIVKGVLLSILGGTTTLGDHMSCNSNLEDLLESPLRGKIFLEVLGVVPEVAETLFNSAQHLKETYKQHNSRFEIIPSPHSIHAVAPEILERLFSSPHGLFSIHLAESLDEQQYFQGSGPLHQLIAERSTPPHTSKTSALGEMLARAWLDSRTLIVHGNYLNDIELKIIGQKGISLVHCPFSHRYFNHRPFPLQGALQAGVNIALGTDSLASATSLSMLEVMREMERRFPKLDRETILSMATLGGAQALQLQDQVGNLSSGKKADAIAIRQLGHRDPLDALFAAEQVDFSMVDGVILAR